MPDRGRCHSRDPGVRSHTCEYCRFGGNSVEGWRATRRPRRWSCRATARTPRRPLRPGAVVVPGPRSAVGFHRLLSGSASAPTSSSPSPAALASRALGHTDDHPDGRSADLGDPLVLLDQGVDDAVRARSIADLFDRYQIYRPTMLACWAEGRDVTVDGHDLLSISAGRPTCGAPSSPGSAHRSRSAFAMRLIDSALTDPPLSPNCPGSTVGITSMPRSLLEVVTIGVSRLPRRSTSIPPRLARADGAIALGVDHTASAPGAASAMRRLAAGIHSRSCKEPLTRVSSCFSTPSSPRTPRPSRWLSHTGAGSNFCLLGAATRHPRRSC